MNHCSASRRWSFLPFFFSKKKNCESLLGVSSLVFFLSLFLKKTVNHCFFLFFFVKAFHFYVFSLSLFFMFFFHFSSFHFFIFSFFLEFFIFSFFGIFFHFLSYYHFLFVFSFFLHLFHFLDFCIFSFCFFLFFFFSDGQNLFFWHQVSHDFKTEFLCKKTCFFHDPRALFVRNR